jgi:hypothetical protein
MKRIALMWIVLTAALLAPTAGFAQVSCTRDGLQRAVDLYIAAQTKGDTSGLPLAMGMGYMENVAPADINKGLIKTPMKIDHQRSLLDTSTCQTLTEVIVTDKEHPYVFDTRLRINHDKIAEIEIMWTTTGYWGFSADDYLKYSSAEKWDTIPVNKRDTRDIGVPSGVNISNRRFVVDETSGAVVAFCTFGAGNANGGSGAPDAHLFRVEGGKLRFVHTVTHLLQNNGPRGAGGGGAPRGGVPAAPGGAVAPGRGAPTNGQR